MPFQVLRPSLSGGLFLTLALMLGLSCEAAQAIGLGRPQVQSQLGRPLDLSIPLSLAEGEQLTDSCVRAEVTAGDVRVPAGLLQMRVEGEPGQQRVRLRSLAVIEEPLLRITLALGCPVRLTREFSAMVDPAPAAAATAPFSAATTPAPTAVPTPLLSPAAPSATVAVAAAGAEAAATAPALSRAPQTSANASAPPTSPRPREAKAHVRTVAKARAPSPRLVLETPEVQVNSAPRPAANAPDLTLTPELEATLAQLEQTVAELRAELQARQAAGVAAAAPAASDSEAASAPASAASALVAAAPRASEAFAVAPVRSTRSSRYRDPLTWLMTLGLALVAGAGAFYWSQWRDLRIRRQRAHWRAVHAAVESPEMEAEAEADAEAAGMASPASSQDSSKLAQRPPMPSAGGAPTASSGAPKALDMLAMPSFTAAAAAAGAGAGARSALAGAEVDTIIMPEQGLPPGVSAADDLLDLQQQLDFLQLLGQQDAAADLLAARVKRGGVGAMPYLMLMELCQQRGEPDAFADLAQQFERRFGMLAPQWPQSLGRGRWIEAYPSVIEHLQAAWADAQAAATLLKSLIAGGAGPDAASFDLPAYRDLLMLYSVARDHYEAGLRGDDVDLMLPLDARL